MKDGMQEALKCSQKDFQEIKAAVSKFRRGMKRLHEHTDCAAESQCVLRAEALAVDLDQYVTYMHIELQGEICNMDEVTADQIVALSGER